MKGFDGHSRGSVLAPVALALAIIALGISIVALTRSDHIRSATTPTTVKASPSACQTKPADSADFVAKVHQSREAAYQSQPVNVTRAGNYVLVFGPLTPTDVVRFRQNKGGGLSFPIDAQQFRPQTNWTQLKPVTVNGATYLHLSMGVADLTEPCTNLRAWVQF